MPRRTVHRRRFDQPKTDHRLRREFVDFEIGKPVEAKDQVKGYGTGRGDYLTFEPDETACKPGLNVAESSARSL